MELLKCGACGFENTEGSKFCKQCGKPIAAATYQTSTEPSKAASVKVSFLQGIKDKEEDRYGSLKSIGTIYKVLGYIVGVALLFLGYKIFTYTDTIWIALVFLLLVSPITMIIFAQAEKIDMSIAQEKSMRECSRYLEKICEYLEQPKL